LGRPRIRKHLEQPPAVGDDFTCEDFHCPQRWGCRHSWLRTRDYWEMIAPWEDGRRSTCAPTFTPYRASFEHQCKHYELDRPREWMQGVCDAPGRPCRGCNMPECSNGAKVVPLVRKA
jgi:hypothetical protein